MDTNTFRFPTGVELSQQNVNAQYDSMIAHEFPEYKGTILDESTQGVDFVRALHEERILAQESAYSGERTPEDCAKMVEGTAIGVTRLRAQVDRTLAG